MLEFSPLEKTWILDVDGTLVKHNGYKIDGYDTLLEGVKEFFEKLSPNEDGHKVSVVYFPYGEGVSSSKIKEKILANYKVLQDKANSHLPAEIEIKK